VQPEVCAEVDSADFRNSHDDYVCSGFPFGAVVGVMWPLRGPSDVGFEIGYTAASDETWGLWGASAVAVWNVHTSPYSGIDTYFQFTAGVIGGETVSHHDKWDDRNAFVYPWGSVGVGLRYGHVGIVARVVTWPMLALSYHF